MALQSAESSSTDNPLFDPRLDEVCRICLFRSDSPRPLSGEMNGVPISGMLQRVSGTVFNDQEALPRVICPRCLAKLSLAYAVAHEFRMQEELLRSFHSRGFLFEHMDEVRANGRMLWYSEEVIRKLKSSEQSQGVFELRDNLRDEGRSGGQGTPTENDDTQFEFVVKEELDIEDDASEDLLQEIDAPSVEDEINKDLYSWLDTITGKDIARSLEKDPNNIPNCSICNKSFTKQRTYIVHTLRHKAKRRGEFRCNVCERTFISKHYLSKHMLLHDKITNCLNRGKRHLDHHKYKPRKSLHCRECPEVFSDKRSYVQHLSQHKRPDDAAPSGRESESKPDEEQTIMSCAECNQAFTKERSYYAHMEMHENIKKRLYVCKFCQKVCGRQYDLRKHEELHVEGRL